MIKLLSFDLQGTLSDVRYSNYFWLEYLAPLKDSFKKIGPYDRRYYDDSLYTDDLATIMKHHTPKLDEIFLSFIESIQVTKIILSTTTHRFIDLELGERKNIFDGCYSSLDDFGIAGKTPKVYKKVAGLFKVKPEEILHIGDHPEMDILHAQEAGCQVLHYTGNTEETLFNIKHLMEV